MQNDMLDELIRELQAQTAKTREAQRELDAAHEALAGATQRQKEQTIQIAQLRDEVNARHNELFKLHDVSSNFNQQQTEKELLQNEARTAWEQLERVKSSAEGEIAALRKKVSDETERANRAEEEHEFVAESAKVNAVLNSHQLAELNAKCQAQRARADDLAKEVLTLKGFEHGIELVHEAMRLESQRADKAEGLQLEQRLVNGAGDEKRHEEQLATMTRDVDELRELTSTLRAAASAECDNAEKLRHELEVARRSCREQIDVRKHARMHAMHARSTRRWQLVARLNSDVERLESTLMSERAAMQRMREEFERGSSLLAEACAYAYARAHTHARTQARMCGRYGTGAVGQRHAGADGAGESCGERDELRRDGARARALKSAACGRARSGATARAAAGQGGRAR